MATQAARRLKVSGVTIAADTEATGLIPQGPWRDIVYNFGTDKAPDWEVRRVCPARPFAFSFADMDANSDYVQYDVDPKTREVIYDTRWDSYKGAQDLLEDERITKVFHNPRYDVLQYEYIGIRVRGPIIDTQILAHIATAGQELTYALKPLSKKWLDYNDDDEKALRVAVNKMRLQAKKQRWSIATPELAGRDPWKADMWLAPRALTQEYAVGDVVRCILLMHLWYADVLNDPMMASLFEREHELMWVLKDMEDRGTRVFPDTVHQLKSFYQNYQKDQVAVANANGGEGLNYGSTVQMADCFYERRGHPPVFTGSFNQKKNRFNYSLNGEQLVKMASGYSYQKTVPVRIWEKTRRRWILRHKHVVVDMPPDPLAKAVLEYKAAGQTIGSFLDVYARYWVEESPGVWVLHPGYKQTGTVTGRLSCSDPNLMQVASETTGRRKADIQSRPREAFGPRPGCYWYLPDYSQIEVWLFAFLSGEERMQEALLSGKDFHGTIAEQVFGAKSDFQNQRDYYRKCAKLIMFAKLYGGGLNKLASLLKMPLDEAKIFIEQYEAELPGVARFMKRMMTQAIRDGVIHNPYGRRYTFEPHYAYASVNYLIQGTAADVMKNALIYVHHMLRDEWENGPRLLLTIHDEILVEVPAEYHSQALMRDIIAAMQRDQQLLKLPVPLPVEMKYVKPNHRWHQTLKPSKDISRAIGAFVKAA